MSGQSCDLAIVGGGLAGGLIALALAKARPELIVRLIEGGETLGGNHRWSWFASDLTPEGAALMQGFPATCWDKGYRVAFPSHQRTLQTPYRSLASADFHARLMRDLPADAVHLSARAAALDARGVSLEGGGRIDARAVVDCRTFAPSRHLSGGWQVFMGRHFRTTAPHGIDCPVIMDAAVAQHDGYRFVYVLPLSGREIFIEDTYYNDGPALDRAALSARIDAYCAAHGWAGEVVGEETGVLPVITGGDFAAFQRELHFPGVARAGARGGFVHPLTSYTLPFAVETALAIARAPDLTGPALAAMLERRALHHWRATGFYRKLGAMLFSAALPHERYRVFERFYRLPAPLIERFYAARSTPADKLRILCGKPPVPIGRAVKALGSRQPLLRPA